MNDRKWCVRTAWFDCSGVEDEGGGGPGRGEANYVGVIGRFQN